MTVEEKIYNLAMSVKGITDKYDLTATLTDEYTERLKERMKAI